MLLFFLNCYFYISVNYFNIRKQNETSKINVENNIRSFDVNPNGFCWICILPLLIFANKYKFMYFFTIHGQIFPSVNGKHAVLGLLMICIQNSHSYYLFVKTKIPDKPIIISIFFYKICYAVL